ncbi:orotidine-5'-phosphate decarboxylase [Campylobacter sp. 19-13652]|uniref:orotidine-5'-phosphate decarboxylase n=1 Tax=Campylobacter sp. 19-13652 TaxID=2840180 RepID=UPI001C760623|nr:orotidine-5'-phosphate decarboxylase [Campylobacter sp. 19-13652]BCX79925.1 orotidine 5'-phosphate decarboxylase [Campylobacter sp. 19-13652]
MKLCVALDLPSLEQNLALAKELKGMDLWLKVGMREFYASGTSGINELKNLGFKLFLDLKLHDIPNTMANAALVLADLEIDMINLHASAGKIAMQTVINALNIRTSRPLVLAVSALTSFSDNEFKKVYNKNIDKAVIDMSKAAYEAGVDGMVCSVFESDKIKSATSDKFITLTPGIRPFGESAADQSRVADIASAKAHKSDFIVVGRPIYEAQKPKEVVEAILSHF